MSLAEKKDLRDSLLLRALEVDKKIAEIRDAWASDGVSTPMSVRTHLERERATLNLDLHMVRKDIRDIERADKAARRADMLVMLTKVLEERDLGFLVREAEQRVAEQPA